MTHYKWLIAKRDREEAEETATTSGGIMGQAHVVYINITGLPEGDLERVARTLARQVFGARVRAVVVDYHDDDPALAYAASKEIEKKVFDAFEEFEEFLEGGEGSTLEEALSRRFPNCLVLSVFDGLDVVIVVAER
jgi:xanthine/CO dehydrogenase XdhC/CoxF family maturation factor